MRIEKGSKTVFTPLEDGTAVLLNLDTRAYYNLNRTGAAVWKQIEDAGAVTLDDLLQSTCDRFEVDEESARETLGRFIEVLERYRMVRVS